jgi:hypothetical protein
VPGPASSRSGPGGGFSARSSDMERVEAITSRLQARGADGRRSEDEYDVGERWVAVQGRGVCMCVCVCVVCRVCMFLCA